MLVMNEYWSGLVGRYNCFSYDNVWGVLLLVGLDEDEDFFV